MAENAQYLGRTAIWCSLSALCVGLFFLDYDDYFGLMLAFLGMPGILFGMFFAIAQKVRFRRAAIFTVLSWGTYLGAQSLMILLTPLYETGLHAVIGGAAGAAGLTICIRFILGYRVKWPWLPITVGGITPIFWLAFDEPPWEYVVATFIFASWQIPVGVLLARRKIEYFPDDLDDVPEEIESNTELAA